MSPAITTLWEPGNLSVQVSFSQQKPGEFLLACLDRELNAFDIVSMVMYKAICEFFWTL